ncbi:hypothetical protein CYLTODRAFT_492861 [Cylindrobasidium torrendii FP15055 ss-10]|uniref:Uncharacterized protein n=1 Tax=Cylindrobasidium torrendii FP15055 ss-10 TaxID=1314674 RepID=A0A0D7B2D6_9AGAR|nr:hypothetical protein CYLTODRAFT_492861 [Cylindrobasidium torrendii FP15055 ss-10]
MINELLPEELLREIFAHSQTHDFEIFGSVAGENVQVATAISHVSQRWRNIALVYPLLWTYILYYGGNTANIDERIRRSGGLALSFYIWLDIEDSEGLAIIRRHLPRMRHLSICAHDRNPDYLRTVLCSYTAPLLESLSFAFHGHENPLAAASVPRIPVIPEYPQDNYGIRFENLHRIYITGIEIHEQVHAFSSLALTSVVIEGTGRLLTLFTSSASTLTTLTLVSPCLLGRPDPEEVPLVLSALQSLTLYNDFGDLPAYLRTPNLKSLECYNSRPIFVMEFLQNLADEWHDAPVNSLERISLGINEYQDVAEPVRLIPSAIFRIFPNMTTLHVSTNGWGIPLQDFRLSIELSTKEGVFPWSKSTLIQADDFDIWSRAEELAGHKA